MAMNPTRFIIPGTKGRRRPVQRERGLHRAVAEYLALALPPDCAWTTNSCQCTKIEGISPDEYCQKYPDRCSYTPADPAAECSKYPGCSWTGSSCQCSSGEGSYTPPPSSGSYDPATECARQSGCSWTGSSCQCPSSGGSSSSGGESYTPPDPATQCAQTAGCSWTGSTCQCNVQGATTNFLQSFFQTLLNRLLGH